MNTNPTRLVTTIFSLILDVSPDISKKKNQKRGGSRKYSKRIFSIKL